MSIDLDAEKKPRRLRNGPKVLTPEATEFVRLYISTGAGADSYRTAYNRPELETQEASNRAFRLLRQAPVKRLVKEAQRATTKKLVISLNERLGLLAEIAQDRKARNSDRIRAVEVYGKTAGDEAPQKIELTGADGGPMVTASVNLKSISVRKKVEGLVAAKLRDREAKQ